MPKKDLKSAPTGDANAKPRSKQSPAESVKEAADWVNFNKK
ncbi:hypothetical protein FACS18949_10270 [Clostridia bacterium]|nr:hypothetical protein FACS18949_10270 [Clostridia bacterium]